MQGSTQSLDKKKNRTRYHRSSRKKNLVKKLYLYWARSRTELLSSMGKRGEETREIFERNDCLIERRAIKEQ